MAPWEDSGVTFWTDPELWSLWPRFDGETLGLFFLHARSKGNYGPYAQHIIKLSQMLPQEKQDGWIDGLAAEADRVYKRMVYLRETYNGFGIRIFEDSDGDLQLRLEGPN